MKYISMLLLLMMLIGCQTVIKEEKQVNTGATVELTPSQIVTQSKAAEWRLLDLENTLYLQLETGRVTIELMPLMAPKHVANTKALVRQGVFDDTQFYRVLDGFVAQGGPMFASEADMKPLNQGAYAIASEFTTDIDLAGRYVAFDQNDGFADETGFIDGFAVGSDNSSGESWLLHCYGALGMGRANELDSGGTELYIVNGPAQRYLDRNVTVFGRVIDGMAHIQALQRSQNLKGPVELTGKNKIKSIQVAADSLKIDQIEIMDTNSASFKALLQARKNRSGQWFIHQHDYMDACGVPIPVRIRQS